jgi:excisionase family DNA binding protein
VVADDRQRGGPVNPEDQLRCVLAAEVVEALLALVEERVAEASATSPLFSQRWLTVEQAAEYLGCSAKAIRGRIDRGRLAAVRDGRRVYVDRQALDAAFAARGDRSMLQRTTQKAPAPLTRPASRTSGTAR